MTSPPPPPLCYAVAVCRIAVGFLVMLLFKTLSYSWYSKMRCKCINFYFYKNLSLCNWPLLKEEVCFLCRARAEEGGQCTYSPGEVREYTAPRGGRHNVHSHPRGGEEYTAPGEGDDSPAARGSGFAIKKQVCLHHYGSYL